MAHERAGRFLSRALSAEDRARDLEVALAAVIQAARREHAERVADAVRAIATRALGASLAKELGARL